MTPLLPGQAAVTHHDGQVCVVLCDLTENLHLGGEHFGVVGGIQRITVAGIMVPVVMVVVRLAAAGEQRFYSAWINELEEPVIESLGTQADLPIILASPLGERVGRGSVPNGLRQLAHKNLRTVSLLAEQTPWGPHHFAAARVFIEVQYPDVEHLWELLGGETAVAKT
jgi:hypothetical protein